EGAKPRGRLQRAQALALSRDPERPRHQARIAQLAPQPRQAGEAEEPSSVLHPGLARLEPRALGAYKAPSRECRQRALEQLAIGSRRQSLGHQGSKIRREFGALYPAQGARDAHQDYLARTHLIGGGLGAPLKDGNVHCSGLLAPSASTRPASQPAPSPPSPVGATSGANPRPRHSGRESPKAQRAL